MTKFYPHQLENYARYEAVRSSGTFNMFNPMARIACGLQLDDYMFVMKNFVALQEEYNKLHPKE